MSDWDLKSLLRILEAVDRDLLIEALIELGLWEEARDSTAIAARRVNDFLVSLIPMPGVQELNRLLQDGIDWLLEQPVENLPNQLDLEDCANACTKSIQACSNEMKKKTKRFRFRKSQKNS